MKSRERAAILSDEKTYKYHVENLRSIEIAIQNAALSARKAISDENHPAIASFVRLFSFLIGAWAETRLRKLLFEKGGYTPEERKRILSQDVQLTQWQKAIEIAFRKHYNVPHAHLDSTTIPFTAYAQYSSLSDLLSNELRLIIEIRNKLAHGQWIYPFNSDNSDIETEKYKLINLENLLSLQFKFNLVNKLSDIIHDLVVSLPTFERDFNKHYRQIETTKTNLKTRKYDDYEKSQIAKRKRGIQRRKKKSI